MAEPTMPRRVGRLPRDRHGRPVPYFVAWIDGQPDFRVIDPAKFAACIREHRCWVCSEQLGRMRSFVAGPMCAVNRTSAEPPSHTDCAEYSAKVCPFLATPHMRRREAGLDGMQQPAGIMLRRNPGVALVWSTRNPQLWDAGNGLLFHLGDPLNVSWWAEGRPATHAEVATSIESGLPALEEYVQTDADRQELHRRVEAAMQLLPEAEEVRS